MGVRVRAVALTDEGKLVVIRRERVGRAVYRVFPGGGVREADNDEVSALKRELEEEISGVATVCRPVFSIERSLASREVEREIFFICQLHSYSSRGGSGSEWKHEDPNNRYVVETIDMDEASLRGAGLLPAELGEILVATKDPLALPSIDI